MAGRIRTIKPEILEDEEVAELSSDAWRLWVSLWTLVDDFGNVHAAPKKLHGQIFWAWQPEKSVSELLIELQSKRRIELYEVNGARFLHVRNWEKHQRIDNAGKERCPRPVEGSIIAAVRGDSRRFAETRGDSPLDEESLARNSARPPTTDQDQDPYPSGVRTIPGSTGTASSTTPATDTATATPTPTPTQIAERAWSASALPGLHHADSFAVLAHALAETKLDALAACSAFKRLAASWSKPGNLNPVLMVKHIGTVQQVLNGEVDLDAAKTKPAPAKHGTNATGEWSQITRTRKVDPKDVKGP